MPEILSRIAQTTAALTREFFSVPRYDWCAPLWHPSSCMLVNHGLSQQSSKKEYKPWKWGATARYNVSHTKDRVTNEEVRAKIQQAIGPHENLLTIVKKHKLQWHGHVSRSSGLANTILQGTVKGGRRQGRQRKRWEYSIREWTGLGFAKSQRATEIGKNRGNWLRNRLWCLIDPRGNWIHEMRERECLSLIEINR